MQNIHVTKAFTLHHPSLEGGQKEFVRGHHSVSEEIADHWFVKGHCDVAPAEEADSVKDARIAALEAENADLQAALALYADAAEAKGKGKK